MNFSFIERALIISDEAANAQSIVTKRLLLTYIIFLTIRYSLFQVVIFRNDVEHTFDPLNQTIHSTLGLVSLS